jgi:hypothetical protein
MISWSLEPLWDLLFGLLVLFFVGIGLLMVVTIGSVHASPVTKLLMVVLALSGASSAVCTFMWRRSWRHVGWDTTFSDFVSEPPPDYPEALVAWRWGRRFRWSWRMTAGALVTIAAIEVASGRWR